MKKLKFIPLLLSAGASVLVACAAWSQVPMAPDSLQQKVQALQQASAENEQRLHTYQWIETTTVTVNGRAQPPRQSVCRYLLDGTLLKTPIGAQSQPPMLKGRPLMRHMEEKKIEEAQESVTEVRNLVARYLPPRPGALQRAFQSNRIGFEHDGGGGNSVVIHDFAKYGDTLSLDLNVATMELRGIRVRSYLDTPSDVLTR